MLSYFGTLQKQNAGRVTRETQVTLPKDQVREKVGKCSISEPLGSYEATKKKKGSSTK